MFNDLICSARLADEQIPFSTAQAFYLNAPAFFQTYQTSGQRSNFDEQPTHMCEAIYIATIAYLDTLFLALLKHSRSGGSCTS